MFRSSTFLKSLSKTPPFSTLPSKSSFITVTYQTVQTKEKLMKAMNEKSQAFGEVLTKKRYLSFVPFTKKPPKITIAEILGHTSFVLVATSYSFSDIYLLRLASVAGSTCMLFFTFYHPHGRILWLPFQWNVLFLGINLSNIGTIMKARSQADRLSPADREFNQKYLSVMDTVDYAALLSIGEMETFEVGDVIFQQAQLNKYVRLVTSGEFDVIVDGSKSYALHSGNFFSDAGIHAGVKAKGYVLTSGTVTCKEKGSCMRFERGKLCDLLENNSSLKKSLQSALSWDIVGKLKRQRQKNAVAIESKESDETFQSWSRRRNVQTLSRYRNLCENLLKEGRVSSDVKQSILKYRLIHVIDEEAHEGVLGLCGWSITEYERGFKESEEEGLKRRRMESTKGRVLKVSVE